MSTCDYYGCDEPLAPDQPVTGMKCCVKHDAEVTVIMQAIADGGSVGPLLKFWIDAQSGPERAAQRL